MYYRIRPGLFPTLTTAVAVVFFSAFAEVSQAGVVFDGDGRVIQITDINVSGSTYTADMNYTANYYSLFTQQSKTPLFLGDRATAREVALNMFSQVQGESISQNHVITVPFDESIGRGNEEVYKCFLIDPFNGSFTEDFEIPREALGENYAGIAQFTLTSVPEPTSLVLFGGLSALGIAGRRRPKQ